MNYLFVCAVIVFFPQSSCQPYNFDFPGNAGSLYYPGVDCPIGENEYLEIPFSVVLSKEVPAGTITNINKWYDLPNQKGNCIFCIEINCKVS